MRQFNHKYSSKEALNEWLLSCNYSDAHSILIQIFSGVIDKHYLSSISKNILEKIPEAVIIGTTTSGEILDGEMLDESVVISLSIFDKTKLKSFHAFGGDSEAMGDEVANVIMDKDTQCVIMFADGTQCNGDAILRGVNKGSLKKTVVAGGMSGDNEIFKTTYCLHGSEVFEQGVVAVALSNPDLEVFHSYNLSWKPIGKKMTITKSDGNILYEVDHQPIKDIYAKYLGENVVKKMPASTIEFPLILHEGGVDVARSMIALSEDGSIIYAGEVPEGKEVRFGVGSPNMLTESAHKNYDLACKHPIEGLFSYSCIARKAFLGKGLEAELHPLANIAPMAGFFTYGEFFHGSDDNKLLNVTTTILGISETKHIKHDRNLTEADFDYSSLTIGALMNLVEVTMHENELFAEELIESNKALQLKDSALNASANGVIITDIDGKIQWANEAYCKLSGYSVAESLGNNPKELVNSKKHKSAFFKSLWDTILSNKVWHGELVNRHKDGYLYNEEMTITPMTNENGEIEHFVAVKQDITERKNMEELIQKYAFYDTLTQLPNRRLLSDRISQVQATCKRSGRYAAIIFLDLDNFKPLNDTYGHTVGDLLLIEVARRLHACVRESDTIARFGGDEFVVLLSELSKDRETSLEQAKAIAEKIQLALDQSYFLSIASQKGAEKIVEHQCTSSIGVALFLNYEAAEDDIIKWADSAMYEAKAAGRDQIKFYKSDESL